MEKVNYKGHYIKGAFEFPDNQNHAGKDHISPADFEDLIFKWPQTISTPVDLAFQNGNSAYLPWARLSLKERVKKLSGLKSIFEKHKEELAQIIARETGKPLWESEGEVRALIAKTDFVLGPGLDRVKEIDVPKAQGRIRFKSRGLIVVIGPFNFPMHLPFGQILPALAVGNTVLFKPSEKTPASGQKLAECFHELQLDKGVFQMIQGEVETSKKICSHKDAGAVVFTGSYETGQKIKEALVKEHSKLLALEMGGYNSALIWKDAKMELALSETLNGCFWTAGQRCSSTSQIIVHKKKSEEFIKKFIPMAEKITVDHWSKNPFMGPLIDELSVQKFLDFQEEARRQGAEVLLEGKHLKEKKGFYVSPGIYKMKFDKSSDFGKQETFTPQVILYETDSLDEALDMINHSGYGLSLSVFSEKKSLRDEIFYRARVGLINYNLSTAGASGLLPFGGLGKSGNDRPAGSFAIDLCVTPLAEKGLDS